MIPQAVADFYAANQELLWVTTLLLDLAGTVILYRLFGKAGLQVAIATAIILANLQGPKLTIIFGLETSLGVIFYSSIFFATDVLSENYGKQEAARAVWMGFVVSVIVLVMMSLGLLLPAQHQSENSRVFAGHPGGVFDHPRLLAALRLRLPARVPDQPAFRRLGISQNQVLDRRTLALDAK